MKDTANRNFELLTKKTYPGRGIIIGASSDAESIFQIYWIMGRSPNSRNRVFVLGNDGSVRTKAHDPALLTDPSLVIYYPVRNFDHTHIISNGDQTDTIYDYLERGNTFEAAMDSREYEPDGPNYTPRIAGVSDISKKSIRYKLAIAKTLFNNGDYPVHQYFHYQALLPGFGHMITTYEDDSSPLESFRGEPRLVPVHDSIDKNLTAYWDALDNDNRVSLMVKQIDLASAKANVIIVNKNG